MLTPVQHNSFTHLRVPLVLTNRGNLVQSAQYSVVDGWNLILTTTRIILPSMTEVYENIHVD